MNPQELFLKPHLFADSPIKCNGKEIYLPKVFGFCGGVTAALRLLEETLIKNSNKKIFLLGDIIHNENVREYFCSRGVEIIPFSQINNIFDFANKDDVIIIPAFGINMDLEKKIREYYRIVIDTTCKDVKKVWEFIKDESLRHSTIIIHGHPYHPEVEASLSYCYSDSTILTVNDHKSTKILLNAFEEWTLDKVELLKEYGIRIVNPEKINFKRISLANQTTMLYNETCEIADEISSFCKGKGYIFNFCKTICRATFNRQNAAINLLREVKPDLVLVVGGYNSSNTNNLYKIARSECKTIFYIKDKFSLIDSNCIVHYDPTAKSLINSHFDFIKKSNIIAILAGASCPIGVVNEVLEKVKKLIC